MCGGVGSLRVAELKRIPTQEEGQSRIIRGVGKVK